MLFATAGLAFAVIAGREIAGLLRLSAITGIAQARGIGAGRRGCARGPGGGGGTAGLVKERRELAEGVARLKQHQRDILDAAQILTLAERELLLPLDRLARAAIGTSGRRVSVVTTLSPAAIIPIAFVAYENFRMLKALAGIYGGRPGFFAILRLLRLHRGALGRHRRARLYRRHRAAVHRARPDRRLSHRLGEGLVNGGFTIRIGIAAVELLRPLPYIEARKPRLREFMAEFLKFGQRAG